MKLLVYNLGQTKIDVQDKLWLKNTSIRINLEWNQVDESIQWNNEWMNEFTNCANIVLYTIQSNRQQALDTRINIEILSFGALFFTTEW